MTAYCCVCRQTDIWKKIKHRDCKKVTEITRATHDGRVANLLRLHDNYCRKCRKQAINRFHRSCKEYEEKGLQGFTNHQTDIEPIPFDKKLWSKNMAHLPLKCFEGQE